jgi:hypothetical protein
MRKLTSQPQLSITLTALGLLLLAACGGQNSADLQPARGNDRRVADFLEEIAAAPVPPGVDAALFEQLRSGLRRSVLQHESAVAPSGSQNLIADLNLSGSDATGWQLNWSYLNTGDYNLDSQVTVADLTPIGIHFGIEAGQSGWLEARLADGDRNDRITVNDLTPIGINFRSTIGGFKVLGGAGTEGPWEVVTEVPLPDLQTSTTIACSLATRDYAFYCVQPLDLQDNAGVLSPASMATPEVVVASVDSITPWQTASIGAGGGSLSGPGVGTGQISASIPAAALSESCQVTLGLASGSVSVDGVDLPGDFVYLCGDPPLQLSQPALISVPFSPDEATLYLPYAVSTGGQLLPLSFDEEAYELGNLEFELRTLYPEPLQGAAAGLGELPAILQGIAFLVRQEREAVREDIRYAYSTKFDPVLDGFSVNDAGLNSVLRIGQESFAGWYFRNYRSSLGPLAERFKDPEVQLKIASRAMAATIAKLGDAYSVNSGVGNDQARSFDMVKAAMRLSGPVMVSYKEGEEFNTGFLALGYRADTLWLYGADKPCGKVVGYPLEAGNSVRLLGDGSLQTYESFENILLDATADPPFGGAESATINITSHQPGDHVESTTATVSGHVDSAYFLVTGLFFWNTREAREQMHYCAVPESGEFALDLPLLPGENRFVVVSLAYQIALNYGVPFIGVTNNNLEDEVFWLVQGEEPLPDGYLRFSVDWESYFPGIACSATDPRQPFLSGYREGVGAFYVTYSAPGSLDAAPFALWEDRSFYTGGQAFNGTYNMTVADVSPGTYSVVMDTDNAAYNLHRITRIMVSGVASGDFTMEDGHAGPNRFYTGVTYDAATGELTKVDQSYYVEF